jgi:transposase
MVANHSRPFRLSEQDRKELERLTRSASTPAGLSRRARAVLLMADQVTGAEVALLTGYTTVQVSRIRRRFAETGVAGLEERSRSGRPPKVSSRKAAQIVAMTLKPPDAGVSHWTTRDMSKKVGLSHSTVHRIWQAHALKPHRIETFKFSNDPKAEEKIYDVVGLYMNPPTNAVVLSVDEKTQIQALGRTQPVLPMRPGLPARQTHDYKRNGLINLYAALEISSGAVIGECSATHNGTDFLRFLEVLNRRYKKRELHVVLDNSSTHKTPAVQAWLEAHPRVHFHFTPTGASWLNMVEAWFSILTRKSVRRGSFDTLKALTKHIHHYIENWNNNPTPFVWTKDPASIIKKAVRRPS